MARVLCIDCRQETVKSLTEQAYDVCTASFGLATRGNSTLGVPANQPYLPHDFDAIVFDIVTPMVVDTTDPPAKRSRYSSKTFTSKKFHCAEPIVDSGDDAQFGPSEIFDACRLGAKAIIFLNADLSFCSWETTPHVVGFGVRPSPSRSDRPEVDGVSSEVALALRRYTSIPVKYAIAETTEATYDEVTVPEQVPIMKNRRGDVIGAAYPVGKGTIYFLPAATEPAEIINALLRPSSGNEQKSDPPDQTPEQSPSTANPAALLPLRTPYKFHVFLSHASEDKVNVVFPLADKLFTRGIRPWVDHQQIKGGDSLRQKIDEGLAQSAHGVIILTRAFFAKKWTNLEMDAFFASMTAANKRIIPVLDGIDVAYVAEHSLLLTGLRAISTHAGLDAVVSEIIDSLKSFDAQPID